MEIIFRLIRTRKKVVIATDINSAIGNDHHTLSTLPVSDKRYAAGRRTTSCLATEVISEYIPFPSAWKTEPHIIQKPAKRKL